MHFPIRVDRVACESVVSRQVGTACNAQCCMSCGMVGLLNRLTMLLRIRVPAVGCAGNCKQHERQSLCLSEILVVLHDVQEHGSWVGRVSALALLACQLAEDSHSMSLLTCNLLQRTQFLRMHA